MKRLSIILSCILALAVVFGGCEKPHSGSIYGVVTDNANGDLIKNAGVELQPVGSKTVTGSEGQYEFTQLEDGEYTLLISQYGYEDFTSSTIKVANGKSVQYDVQIQHNPPVQTLMATEVSPTTAVLNGKLVSNDDHFTEVGFVYGTMPTPSLTNGAQVTSSTSVQLGDFSEDISGLVTGGMYYYRAFARNDETAAYGSTINFIAEIPKYVVLQAAGLMVAKVDAGIFNWSGAMSTCENSILSGYTDWYLPSKDELMILYNNKNLIGGFSGDSYWSSTEFDSDNAWEQNFNYGDQSHHLKSGTYRVRCVRRVN